MEVNQNNIIKERVIKIISQKNFIFFIFLTALLIASFKFVLFSKRFGRFITSSCVNECSFSFILFKNSKKLFSIKLLSSVILINVSFFVTLGGINYDSSSFFFLTIHCQGNMVNFWQKNHIIGINTTQVLQIILILFSDFQLH